MNHVLSRARAVTQGQALRWARPDSALLNVSKREHIAEPKAVGEGGAVGDEAATLPGARETD